MVLTPNPVDDALMVSLLLQSVKNTASHPCPVSLIAVKVLLLTQCFTFVETGVGAGKKK